MPTLADRLRRLFTGATATEQAGTGLFRIGAGSGGFISTGWDFSRISNVVYGNPTGFRCVEAIASNFSRPNWQITRSGETQALASHPLLTLLSRPNPSMSGTMMQRALARDLELLGKSFWMKLRGVDGWGRSGPVTELRRLPAQRVTVLANSDEELLGFIYTDRVGGQTPILPETLLYLRYPHPERIYDGFAPALIAALAAETDNTSSRFNQELLANDAAMPGFLILKNTTPQQFADAKQQWESGSMPGKTRFLSGEGAEYIRVGQTNQELTYTDLRRKSQDDILRAFGVPRAVAFDVEETTYANAATEKAMFMQQNIHPKWVLIGDEMTLQLGDGEAVVGFDLTGIDELQDSRDAVIDRAVKLLGVQATTVNEVRATQGWGPVEWGDKPVAPTQPMSAIPLEPPAPNGNGTKLLAPNGRPKGDL